MDHKLDSSAAALAQWGARRNRMLDTYFRGALRERYEHLRAASALDTRSLDRYHAAADALRTRLIDEGLGGWPARPPTVSARETQIAELEPGNLYRVHVEVLPEVEMMALLLVPHAAATRAAPAVICQHGYAGSPEWAMGFATPGVGNYMNSCGHRLAAAGYVVLAPHIVCSPPGVGEDRVRLDRLARMSGRSLLGFEMFELSRMIDYLQTRVEVLPERIGMYGISQGGLSTLFAAACDTRIRAAVCSCYFNDRWRKMFEHEHLRRRGEEEGLDYGAYLHSTEDDKFNPWAAPLWPDSVLASLICPRPFMAEVGRYDSVIDWRDAIAEFDRVRRIYGRLGVADRAELSVGEWGGHEMFYDGPKRFLDRWLRSELDD